MITYYSIVHADTKRRVEWQKGKPGYGWDTRPHQVLEKIKSLEDSFEDDGKLVMRQVIGGARPMVTFITLAEAKVEVPESAEAYLRIHPELTNDRAMQSTLKALRFFRERGQRTKAREEEELF